MAAEVTPAFCKGHEHAKLCSAAMSAAAHAQQQFKGHLLPWHPFCVSAPVRILDHKLLHTFLCLHRITRSGARKMLHASCAARAGPAACVPAAQQGLALLPACQLHRVGLALKPRAWHQSSRRRQHQ